MSSLSLPSSDCCHFQEELAVKLIKPISKKLEQRLEMKFKEPSGPVLVSLLKQLLEKHTTYLSLRFNTDKMGKIISQVSFSGMLE